MAHEYDYESEDFDFQCESFKSQVNFFFLAEITNIQTFSKKLFHFFPNEILFLVYL